MDFITTSQVARDLQASEASIRNWADSGRLRVATKLPDGTRLFDPRDVARFAAERRQHLAVGSDDAEAVQR